MKKKLQFKKTSSSIFIRANNADDLALIESIKKQTNNKAASQAFLSAAAIYMRQLKQIEQLQKDNAALKSKLQEAMNLITHLNSTHQMLFTFAKDHKLGKYPQGELP
jgi:hypothetical protein